MPASLRLGTRGSKLALAQAVTLKAELERLHEGLSVEIVPITTSGDKGNRDVLGAFVREIQVAVLEGRVDAALHCLKDLPTEPVAGLHLAAHLEREDPRDVLIGRVGSVAELPHGSHIGTGSARRTAQLAAARNDLTFSPLVGNIDTRLRKLSEGQYDAIILALAGLKRLGLLGTWAADHPDLYATPLEFDEMLPAPGQAVLVLETRADDDAAGAIVSALNHEDSRLCSAAERAFLGKFGGGCSVPVAAFATRGSTPLPPSSFSRVPSELTAQAPRREKNEEGGENSFSRVPGEVTDQAPRREKNEEGGENSFSRVLSELTDQAPRREKNEEGGDSIHLRGLVAAPDGSRVLRGTATGDAPEEVANTLFEELKAHGAVELFQRDLTPLGGTR